MALLLKLVKAVGKWQLSPLTKGMVLEEVGDARQDDARARMRLIMISNS